MAESRISTVFDATFKGMGPTGHTFILVLVIIMTDLITDDGTRETIVMITINKNTDIIDTNTMAERTVNVVKVS